MTRARKGNHETMAFLTASRCPAAFFAQESR